MAGKVLKIYKISSILKIPEIDDPGEGGFPKKISTPTLIYFALKSPFTIFVPYNNPFWQKSMRWRKKRKVIITTT